MALSPSKLLVWFPSTCQLKAKALGMASIFPQFLSTHNPPHPPLYHLPTQTTAPPSHLSIHRPPRKHLSTTTCATPNPTQPDFPSPDSETTTSAETFPIEKRRKSDITRDRSRSETSLARPEPPNFEIGWKRTKEIKLEKPIGYVIADFLEKLEDLMGKEFGSTELLLKVAEIVAERAREEAQVLRDEGKVEDRMVTELFRVLRLIEMDMVMVKAAVKEETLTERLEQAKARCRQAILVALSF